MKSASVKPMAASKMIAKPMTFAKPAATKVTAEHLWTSNGTGKNVGESTMKPVAEKAHLFNGSSNTVAKAAPKAGIV